MKTTAYTLQYNKLKAFLKAEDKESEGAPRIDDHPNGLDKLVGTGSCFFVVPPAAVTEMNYPLGEGPHMSPWFEKKEKLEPIACLRPTAHLFEVVHWRRPTAIYRRLDYTQEGETKHIWIDRRFLDILEPDFSELGSLTGVWKIELVEPNLVRVKKGSEYSYLNRGKQQTWETVMYCGRADLKGEELK